MRRYREDDLALGCGHRFQVVFRKPRTARKAVASGSAARDHRWLLPVAYGSRWAVASS
jgi:hypothetical protein